MSRSAEWTPSLWLETFDELLNEDNQLDYGDPWTLNFNYSQTDQLTHNERKRGWKIYSPCVYGRFKCASCHKIWPSARVVVLFRYRLLNDQGTVIMRPFGQACRSCQDDVFYRPGFSDKDVENTLLKLFAKIAKNCYGEEEDDEDGSSACSTKVFTKPHEKDLCEGCRMGICCQDED